MAKNNKAGNIRLKGFGGLYDALGMEPQPVEQKPEQKPEQKFEHKPEQKFEKKPVQKPEQKYEHKPEQKFEQKPVNKSEQKPVQSAMNNLNDSNTFINPYTFIPIPGEAPERKSVERGMRSGVLECALEIVSPTFIPNTTRQFAMVDAPVEHMSYEFYSYDDLSGVAERPKEPPKRPVIPGSELRGMIRNVYEQLTNSCFLIVDESNLPYKRTPQPKIPALMKYNNQDGKWYLYEKPVYVRVALTAVGHLKPGTRLDIITHGKEQVVKEALNGRYVLHCTGLMNKKTSQVAFDPESGINPIPLTDDVLLRFDNVISSYCDKKVNKNSQGVRFSEAYSKRFEARKPLFVYTDGTKTYLSPSQMTKEYFVNKIPALLEKHHDHKKCEDRNYCCPACRLFGMIGENGVVAGRVRFSDAVSEAPVSWLNNAEWFTLPILGKPHISATEFYLLPPLFSERAGVNERAMMWNYDYYYKDYMTARDSKGRKTIDYDKSKINYTARLAGRKVYWHGRFHNVNSAVSQMNQTARLLDGGTFGFKLFFEDLTDDELGDLMFCLTLRGKGLHKIGRGKPIGMGSVKLSVGSVKYRVYEYDKLTSEFSVGYESAGQPDSFGTARKDAARLIMNYAVPLDERDAARVKYPEVDKPASRTFEWFSKNRGSVQKPRINQVLPLISDSDKSLYK